MGLAHSKHKVELREAGWHSRGYLPHFDGREVPQFVSLHLFDSVPASVPERWKRELDVLNNNADRILLQRRIEKYLDGSAPEKSTRTVNTGSAGAPARIERETRTAF